MQENQYKKQFNPGFCFLRGFAVFGIFMIIKWLMTLYCLVISLPDKGNGDFYSSLPTFAIFIVVTIGSFFIYNSLISFMELYNRRAMKNFLDKKKPKIIFREEIWEIITSREYLIEMGTTLFFSYIAAIIGGFPEYRQMFAPTGAPSPLLTALPFIAISLYIPIISALARYEVRRSWHYLDNTDKLDTLYNIFRIIGKAVIILLGYIFVFPLSPIILVAYLSIFGIFGQFFDFYFIVIALTVIAIISALVISIRALNAISTRKKFIKRLSRVAKESGYELSEIARPYASLFKPMCECSFTLKHEGKIFSCRMIGPWWHRAPLYFISDKHAFFRHRLGTNEHHIDMLGEFCYDFPGEGQKLLILNPVPKRAYVTKANTPYIEHSWFDEDMKMSALTRSGKSRGGKLTYAKNDDVKKIEPGDKIWNYTIYNTTSFIGAVDRKCLGRTNGMFE